MRPPLSASVSSHCAWTLKPELRNGMAAKGRKERKAKLLVRTRTGLKFFHLHPCSARLLCVLCALWRLNFGVRVKSRSENDEGCGHPRRRPQPLTPALPMSRVAQPSRLRVRAASRRLPPLNGAGRPGNPQAGTPAPQWRFKG